MMTFKIAFRNILRNRRRSAMTVAAISAGGIALLLLGAFMAFIIIGFEVLTIRSIGHLSVFRNGYFEFGTGNPAGYGISDYEFVIKLIHADPVLGPLIEVATPTVTLFGIAGNFDVDASKTFFGVGVVPSDRERMRKWDQFDLGIGPSKPLGLSENDQTRGVIGVGLARILGLCRKLDLANCPPQPPQPEADPDRVKAVAPEDFSDLVNCDIDVSHASPDSAMPRLDLLGATANGAPNVVSIYVAGVQPEGIKEIDDAYVGMHLALAQQLLYGRGTPKVTSIVLQLHHTEDMSAARARLASLFEKHHLELEVRDFTELEPMYNQIVGMFGTMFSFIAVIMGMIVLFTIVNTMSMSVMERTNEIGTARAMGVRRQKIRIQFVVEGGMIGTMGATIGLIVAVILVYLINRAGLTWTPPGQAGPVPLLLFLSGVWSLIIGTWLGLVVVATLASLIPANRGARMPVVDALRHV